MIKLKFMENEKKLFGGGPYADIAGTGDSSYDADMWTYRDQLVFSLLVESLGVFCVDVRKDPLCGSLQAQVYSLIPANYGSCLIWLCPTRWRLLAKHLCCKQNFPA